MLHNVRMFDWNGLRYFLAVARHGSTLAAARALGVNQSTVHRRLMELERKVGHALVRRHPTGYRLTELGEALRPAIERVDEAVAGVERQVRDHGNELVGTIRLTCPEPLVSRITSSPLLDLFHERHPRLRVEFVMSDGYLDLSKGEADIALRSGEPADENLVGRKIGDSIWAVYASQSYIQHNGRPHRVEDIADHSIVGFDGMLVNHRAAKWFASVAPNAKVAARNNSVLGVLMAVKSGVGVAPLPTTIADMHDDLVQVLPPVRELTRGWYLLTHPDLRTTPRIRAFFDFVVEKLDLVRPILMG
ncbi:LysR family transcriptional regulator [Mesorhizobium sp. Root102]|uniref:LysR family transcriptional regulator n=1 Tax=Mesorhizobium sp. Root102 TaxID=1736422 RepID=UPI001AECC7E7|nr:LysR family transcriptional regulator [Mesorhizobium sp. Root102]